MMIIYLNALTVILVVIFLQIMMFIRNAVPLTTGILMSSASSVTYFVMSIITLLFLYACHEAASYMIIKYTPFIILFYAILILILGIVCMAIDVGGANQAAQDIWPTLSPN